MDYDELRRIYRLERNTSKLVNVDDDFIDSIKFFVEEEKKKYLASLKNFSSSDAREFSNMRRIVEEIFTMREKKILNKALIAVHTKEVDKENMAKQELEMFGKLLKVLEEHSSTCRELFGEREQVKEDVTVEILSSVPTFVGADMKEYGPFSTGQKVSLPKKVAKLFITRKLAKES